MGGGTGHHVHGQGDHTARQTIAADVLAADPQRTLRQLAQHHAGIGTLGRHRKTHAAAAGAQVQHPAFPQRLHKFDGSIELL